MAKHTPLLPAALLKLALSLTALCLSASAQASDHPKTIQHKNQPVFKPEAHIKAPPDPAKAAPKTTKTASPTKPEEPKKKPNAYIPKPPSKKGMKTELPQVTADDVGPTGLWPDQTPPHGDWVFGYAWRHTRKSGLRSGKSGVNAPDVVNLTGRNLYTYTTTPTRQNTLTHRLQAAYGLNDRTALLVGVPYVIHNRDSLTNTNLTSRTKAEGLGDIRVITRWKIPTRGGAWHAHLGLSLPTGSVDEKDDTPLTVGAKLQLPYSMQLGSGTMELLPGLSFKRQGVPWTVGAQMTGAVSLGTNKRDYKPGARLAATAYAQYNFTQRTSAGARLLWESWGDLAGNDKALNPATDPTMDSKRQGGRRISLGLGLNILGPDRSDHHRVSLEVLAPIWQTLNGPQLELERSIQLDWRVAY